ncbi:hypothetical protein [Actinomadura geliboluensis]|uniref:hypothetical protein n=1 Tax=Actinomadura geliboluensis TaxID=882440 RepID=UPI002615D19F|nr:hypothetical protein [Actinomadura geliboluensis]
MSSSRADQRRSVRSVVVTAPSSWTVVVGSVGRARPKEIGAPLNSAGSGAPTAASRVLGTSSSRTTPPQRVEETVSRAGRAPAAGPSTMLTARYGVPPGGSETPWTSTVARSPRRSSTSPANASMRASEFSRPEPDSATWPPSITVTGQPSAASATVAL